MDTITASRRIAVALLGLAIVVASLSAPVAAQSDNGAGGTIVVQEGETVDNVNAFAGNVIVRGTVTGDVGAAAGNVRVEEGGEVRGDVEALAGNVEIAGTVDGDVSTASGNLVVAETGSIAGSLDGAAGTIQLDGQITGDVQVAAETITIGDAADIGGDLTYAGTLQGNEGAVAGTVTEDATVGPDVAPTVQPLASWLFALYTLVLNLLLGAVLLALFPRFSRGVAERVATTPLRAGLVGFAVLIGVPILLVAIAITVIGIPITILGAFAFALVVWIGVVYGWFAVAAWLLSYAEVDSAWIALVVGLVGGAVISQLPVVGGLLSFLVLLLGLGALSMGVYGHLRRRREPAPRTTTGPAAD